MAIGYDGSLNFNTKIDDTGFNRGTKKMSSGLAGVGKSLKGIASTVGLVIGAVAVLGVIKQSIQLASDLAEVQNVVDVAFGNMAYKIEEFSKTSIKSFGMSELSAKQTASTYMAIGSAMDINKEQASDMSIALTGLSADMASFYNIRQKDADIALKSVYTGETETLKKYGIVMSVANLEAYALSQGIQTSYQEMANAERVQLRYNYVMNATKLAQGDFIRTGGGWANQVRVLSEQWKEFLTILGNGLIAVLLPVVRGLNMIVGAIINIAKTIAAVIGALFGKQIKAQVDLADSADVASTSQDKLGEATKKAGQKAKKSLSSFDELNILQENIASSADSASGGLDGGSFDIGNQDVATAPKVPPFFANTIDGIAQAVTDWKKESAGLQLLTDAWGRFKGALEDVGLSLKPFKETMKDTFGRIGKLIGDVALNTLEGVLYGLAGALDVVTGAFMWLDGVLSGDVDKQIEGSTLLFQGLGEMIEGVFIVILGKEAVESIKVFIKEWGTRMARWWKEDVKPWFTKEKWAQLWTDVKQGWADGWAGVGVWWQTNGVRKWFDEKVAPWFTAKKWADMMVGVKAGFGTAFHNAIEGVRSQFNKMIYWLNDRMRISWPELRIAGKYIAGGGSTQVFKLPYIPKLATGGVIPPNSSFLAMMGDQKNGRNLEAPENLIRQIVREESGGSVGTESLLNDILFAIKDGKVMVVDKTAFAKVVSSTQGSSFRVAGSTLIPV